MISVAGSAVNGQSKKELERLLTSFVVPVAYTYNLLDDLQEKVRILSVPPLPTGRQARSGPGSHFGRKGTFRSMGIEIALF
jgi:hypothetical protein